MRTLATKNSDRKEFVSHAPGYWPDVRAELWNDWHWQLKNRVTTLAQLEQHLELSDDERVALLLEDYDFFVKDQKLFCERLDALIQLRGKAVVRAWQEQVAAGDIEAVVRELLLKHYDPGYASSIARNFMHYTEAKSIAPVDRSAAAMAELAREILRLD